MGCGGVDSLGGLKIAATGWVKRDGLHVVRETGELKKLMKRFGATLQEEAHQHTTDLLILGDLLDHQYQDDRIGGVDAIEQVYLARQIGRHVHMVHTGDLGDLLRGERVPCRLIPRGWVERKKKLRTSIRRGYL